MKDRTQRTGVRKASHRLRNAFFGVAALSITFSSLSAFYLIHYTQECESLNKTIENYNVQIDLIEQITQELVNHNK
jgi:hypothetical protein